MAQTVLTIAGYAVGAYFGNPQLGAIIGSAIGAQYELSQLPDQEIGRQADLTLPRVDYGEPLSRFWGRYRTPGRVLWQGPIQERVETTDGGKGGGPEQKTYTYYCDVLYEVAHNEIDAVPRIWRNAELVYNLLNPTAAADLAGVAVNNSFLATVAATIGASVASTAFQEVIVYTGDAGQLPDPTYEADVGVGRAPAYLGRGTVLLRNVFLGSGKQLPVFLFEVFRKATFGPLYVETGSQEEFFAAEIDQLVRTVDGSPIAAQLYRSEFQIVDLVYGAGLGSNGILRTATPIAPVGKRYFEVAIDMASHSSANNVWIQAENSNGKFGSNQAGGFTDAASNGSSADLPAEGPFLIPFGSGPSGSYRIVMYAFDFDNNKFWVGLNGVWASDTGQTLYSGNPANNVAGRTQGLAGGGDTYIYLRVGSPCTPRVVGDFRTARSQFTYEPPYGFIPWSSQGEYADVWSPLPTYLDEVVEGLCELGGIDAADVDASDLASIQIEGVPITSVSTIDAALETLASAYHFECYEADKIYFRRIGSSPVATISADECCAAQDESSEEEAFSIEQANDLEVPARFVVKYTNLLDDYQQGSAFGDRQIGASEEIRAVNVPIVLRPTRAQALANTLSRLARLSSTPIRFSIDHSRPTLSPTDVVLLQDAAAGSSYRARIRREAFDGLIHQFECVLDDPNAITTTGAAPSFEPSITIAPVQLPEYIFFDGPLLRDDDDAPGIYLAIKTNQNNWGGVEVYLTRDGGSNFAKVATLSTRTVGGIATNVLGDWGGGNTFDYANYVDVNVGAGNTLASFSEDAIISGSADGYALGISGRWEVFYAKTATLLSPGIYRLTGLLRGRRGTEWAMGLHEVNDSFIALRQTGIVNVPLQQADLNGLVGVKLLPPGRSLSSLATLGVQPTFERLKPLAPVNLRVVRDGSNNAIISCSRRSRIAHPFLSSAGNPPLGLGEFPEAYIMQVFSNGTYGVLKRTWNVGGNGAGCSQAYSAAEQTADGLTPGDPLFIRIYQVSTRVGSGHVLQGSA